MLGKSNQLMVEDLLAVKSYLFSPQIKICVNLKVCITKNDVLLKIVNMLV